MSVRFNSTITILGSRRIFTTPTAQLARLRNSAYSCPRSLLGRRRLARVARPMVADKAVLSTERQESDLAALTIPPTPSPMVVDPEELEGPQWRAVRQPFNGLLSPRMVESYTRSVQRWVTTSSMS